MIVYNGIPSVNSIRDIARENQKAQKEQIEHVASRMLTCVQRAAESGHMQTYVSVASLIPKRKQSPAHCLSWWRSVQLVTEKYASEGFTTYFSRGAVDPSTDALVGVPWPAEPCLTGIVSISWELRT